MKEITIKINVFPAIPGITLKSNFRKIWRTNRKIHRNDGAALEYESGYKELWIDGIFVVGKG